MNIYKTLYSHVTTIHCKAKRFQNKGTRATKILELIHLDLCGSMEEKSFSGVG